jgi:hypothetical protein
MRNKLKQAKRNFLKRNITLSPEQRFVLGHSARPLFHHPFGMSEREL